LHVCLYYFVAKFLCPVQIFRKIDAVYIGGGEKELVVINPKAIKANKGK